MPCSLCAWRDGISWCLRQLADWRWPRLFLSTLTTTPSTLAFSHSPAQNEGKVKREMASDACATLPPTRDDERNQMPPTSLSTTPSSSLPPKNQLLRGSKPLGLSQRRDTPASSPPSSAPCLDSRLCPPPCRRWNHSPGGRIVGSLSRRVVSFSIASSPHFFSSSSSLNRVCLFASAHRPPPRPPQSSFVHHWGSPDPVLYMP